MTNHIPVLQKETIALLDPKPNENFIDLTLGHGGLSLLILEKTGPMGQLLGIDQDEDALEIAKKILTPFSERITLVNDNFTEIGLIARKWQARPINGIIIDLGPNTTQLTSSERGFSFLGSAKLDMRMDRTRTKITAEKIINEFPERKIIEILKSAEVQFAGRIAHRICEARRGKPISTTSELVEIIKQATPPEYRFKSKSHFATDTFRALRLQVNDELDNLSHVLPQAVSLLDYGGRLAVISFHSLEDRIVKNFLRNTENLEILTKKPITPKEDEISNNSSSRSAKLRGARKLSN